MQTRFTSGGAAFAATLASVPFLLAVAISAPTPAFAACGSSGASGAHAAASGGGVHAASAAVATSAGVVHASSPACPTGASAAALHGLPTAGSGRVVETGAHAARREIHASHASTRTTNAAAHLRAMGRHV